MKHSLIFAIFLTASAMAQNTSANGGHHGGGNSGAMGAAAGAFGGSPAASGQSGSGSRYSLIDSYQPWPQDQMASFQKPQWTPYTGK